MKILETRLTNVLKWSHRNGYKNCQGGHSGWKWVPTTTEHDFLLVKVQNDRGFSEWRKPHKDCGLYLSEHASLVLTWIERLVNRHKINSYERLINVLNYARERGHKVSELDLIEYINLEEVNS